MSYDYETFWDEYEGSGAYNPSQMHRFRILLKEIGALLGHLDAPSGVKLLDVGCGMGHLIHALHRKYPSLQYSGIDISSKTIEALKQKFPFASWKSADIQKPMDPAEFGAHHIVVCSEVIEHCEKDNAVLENLARLTLPGGFTLVSVPGGTRYRIDHDIGHLRHYTLEKAKAFYPEETLRLHKAYRWGFPFLNLFRYVTDLMYPFVRKNFVAKKYGPGQKLICYLAYASMFLSLPNAGIQLVTIFKKAADPKAPLSRT